MITTCYRTPAGDLLAASPPLTSGGWSNPATGCSGWTSTTSRAQAAEPLLAGVFGFHVLTIDDCYNTLVDPPKVDDYGSYVFVIVHSVSYDGHRRKLNIAELNLYVGPNFVVSFHRQPVRGSR